MEDQQERSNETNTNENGNGTTNPPVTSDWEKKYKGLQTSYNKTYSQLQDALKEKESLEATLHQYEAQIKAKEDDFGKLNKELESLNEKIGESTKEIESAKRALDRKNLIIEKFPNLAKMEALGLLPDAEDVEKLEEKFSKFSEALEEERKQAFGKQMTSSTPLGKQETKQKKLSEAEIIDRLIQISGDPSKADEFNRLNELLLEYK